MTDLASISALVEQYSKHGWQLRRALLSESSAGSLGKHLSREHPGLVVVQSADEALWFSRRSVPGREAWELRRLSGSPFALVANIDDTFSGEQREDVLLRTQQRMFDGSHPEPLSH